MSGGGGASTSFWSIARSRRGASCWPSGWRVPRAATGARAAALGRWRGRVDQRNVAPAGLTRCFHLRRCCPLDQCRSVLSTWIARLGRAFAVAVAAYAVVGLGWPVLVRTLFDGPLGVGLAAISPFYGSYTLIASLAFPRFIDDAFLWIPCWIAGETAIAAGLLLATLATFDRCLGRMRSFGRNAP